MRRFWIFILVMILSSPSSSFSVLKIIPGASCNKSGSTQIYNGYQFTCIKSGKRLIWNKGAKVKAPLENNKVSAPSKEAPQNSPDIPTNSINSGTPCKVEMSQVVFQGKYFICTTLEGRNTWQVDTLQNLKYIWNDVHKLSLKKPLPTAALELRKTSNVNEVIETAIFNSLKDASRFWQDQYLPKTPLPVLFFTEKDREWFGSQMRKMGLEEKCVQQQLNQFDDEVKRNGDHVNAAGYAGCGPVTFFDFYIGTARNEIGLNDLKVGAHEYTHSGQFGALTPEGADFAPCWFIEGGAEFYGTVLGARDITDLKNNTHDQVWGDYYLSNLMMGERNQSNLEAFLESNGNNYNHQECGPNGAYPVGAQATAYLYLLKGQPGIINFIDAINKTHDYKLAIEQSYGITWEQMKKEMAAYIRLVVAQTPRN